MLVMETDAKVVSEPLMEDSSAVDTLRSWFVIYTKSRQEKALARDLECQRISHYLPTFVKQSYVRNRVVYANMPLFPSYLFLWGTDDERVDALKTNRISRILEVPDPESLEADLSRIKDLIASGAALSPERRLVPGHRVRVMKGPLVGLEGTVVCRRGECRLIIAVEFLQQGASVAIDDFMIEPIG